MREKQNAKEEALLKAIAYLDIFEYPVTAFEAWQWAWFSDGREQVTLGETFSLLKNLEEKGYLQSRMGFFYLKGRERLMRVRKERYIAGERKFRKALRYAKWFRFLPGVRMVAICNNLAMSNAREESDIDFLIVARAGMIWVARFFTTTFVKLFGKRPSNDRTKDTLCLSFFLSEEAMDLKWVVSPCFQSHPEEDVYLAYWARQLVPLYDAGEYGERFWMANEWIASFLPNAFPRISHPRRFVSSANAWLRRWLEWICDTDIVRASTKALQEQLFSKEVLRQAALNDTSVIINDSVLKFHTEDRRALYARAWKKKISSFL